MGSNRKREYQTLLAIWNQIRDCESKFLTPSDLQDFGILASPVELTDGGVPNFDPCFFEPGPAGIFEKYPIDDAAALEIDPSYERHHLWDFLTLQAARDTVQKENPDAKDPEEAAKELFKERLDEYNDEDNFWRAQILFDHVRWDHEVVRREGEVFLKNLATINREVFEGLDTDFPSMSRGTSMYWREGAYLLADQSNSPVPHAICSIMADVDATMMDQCLTIHEVQATMGMVIRAHQLFKKHPVCPMLLISYMGRRHGRITQIVLEGGRVTLQYSKLWSFEYEETAPLELFVRYMLSEPIGLERPRYAFESSP